MFNSRINLNFPIKNILVAVRMVGKSDKRKWCTDGEEDGLGWKGRNNNEKGGSLPACNLPRSFAFRLTQSTKLGTDSTVPTDLVVQISLFFTSCTHQLCLTRHLRVAVGLCWVKQSTLYIEYPALGFKSTTNH